MSVKRASVELAAVAAALSLLGDSALYVVLPREAAALGLTGWQTGVLLSVNRFARLALNEPTGRIVARFGARGPLAVALALAAATTLASGHAAAIGFGAFVAARVVWGFAWSLVRHAGNVAVLVSPAERRGQLLGTFRSVARVGSLVAVLAGAWLVQRLGLARGYELLALATLPGIAIALAAFAPGTKVEVAAPGAESGGGMGLVLATLASFFASATGTSLLVATATLRLVELGPGSSLALAGVAGSGRWIAEIAVAPLAGRATDRFGRRPVLVVGAFLAMGSLGQCALVASPVGFVVAALAAFAALSILQAALDTIATDRAGQGPAAVLRLGRYHTFVDAGTAIGPFLGPALAPVVGLPALYLVGAGVALAIALLAFTRGRPREIVNA